jgi:hypothetical protein
MTKESIIEAQEYLRVKTEYGCKRINLKTAVGKRNIL